MPNSTTEISRRDVVLGCGQYSLFVLLSLITSTAGTNSGPDLNVELFLSYEAAKTKDLLLKYLRVPPILDVWKETHSVSVPSNPEKTLLLGEFNIEQVLELIGPTNSQNERYTATGIEVMSWLQESEERKKRAEFAVIAVTDGQPPEYDRHLHLFPYIEEKTMNTPRVVGGIINGVNIAFLQGMYILYKRNPSTPPEGTTQLGMLRREFLRVSGITGLGFAIGTANRNLMRRINNDGENSETFKVEDMPPNQRMIYEIYGSWENLNVKIRNQVMLINTLSLSAINLPEIVEQVQLSFAQGHDNILRLATRDIQTLYTNLYQTIKNLLLKHIEVIEYFKETDVYEDTIERAKTSCMIISDYFAPLFLRVNDGKGVSFDDIRSAIDPEASTSSAFEIFCHVISELENEYTQNRQDGKLSLLQALATVISYDMSRLEDQRLNGKNFTFGLAGAKDKISQSYTIFGREYQFSGGLLANIV